MKINNKIIDDIAFAYDGEHKIYVLESEQEIKDAETQGYKTFPIEMIKDVYNNSNDLRFIYNWALTKIYAKQFEPATFDGFF